MCCIRDTQVYENFLSISVYCFETLVLGAHVFPVITAKKFFSRQEEYCTMFCRSFVHLAILAALC